MLNATDFDEMMTTKEAVEYWLEYKNEDPILMEYNTFEDWYKDTKDSGYIKD